MSGLTTVSDLFSKLSQYKNANIFNFFHGRTRMKVAKRCLLSEKRQRVTLSILTPFISKLAILLSNMSSMQCLCTEEKTLSTEDSGWGNLVTRPLSPISFIFMNFFMQKIMEPPPFSDKFSLLKTTQIHTASTACLEA